MAKPKAAAAPHPGPPPGPPPRPLPENPLLGTSNKQPAVTGNSQTNIGVLGQSLGSAAGPATDGVFGLGQNGVHGSSGASGGSGIFGENYGGGTGVLGTGSNGVHGKSGSAGGIGILGEHSSNGTGVSGASPQGHGIHGKNGGGSGMTPQYGAGVWGESDFGYGVYGASKTNPGVQGVSSGFDGVHGESQSAQHAGVSGVNTSAGFGVYGYSDGNSGVVGKSSNFNGGWFESAQAEGVRGVSHNANHGGVVGVCMQANGIGVFGYCDDGTGTLVGTGVYGKSSQGEGVHGETNSATMAAVAGIMINPNGTGAGLYGESRGKGPAGFFKGDVLVTGDISLINGDCAEDFNISGGPRIEPGTVMVIQEGDALQMSHSAYDKRVAGVISGAGSLKPAVVLGKQSSQDTRMPLALLGKVYCRVDASYSPVEVGDLLTTSPTPGHAMKATDPVRAFGAVIGKALEPLDTGQGLIPILVALQ